MFSILKKEKNQEQVVKTGARPRIESISFYRPDGEWPRWWWRTVNKTIKIDVGLVSISVQFNFNIHLWAIRVFASVGHSMNNSRHINGFPKNYLSSFLNPSSTHNRTISDIRKQSSSWVLDLEVFVRKLLAIYGFSSRPIVVGEVWQKQIKWKTSLLCEVIGTKLKADLLLVS